MPSKKFCFFAVVCGFMTFNFLVPQHIDTPAEVQPGTRHIDTPAEMQPGTQAYVHAKGQAKAAAEAQALKQWETQRQQEETQRQRIAAILAGHPPKDLMTQWCNFDYDAAGRAINPRCYKMLHSDVEKMVNKELAGATEEQIESEIVANGGIARFE